MIWSQFRILKIMLPEQVYYKVFVTQGMSEWRINSGIVSWDEKDGVVSFKGESGSLYLCWVDGKDSNSSGWDHVLTQVLGNPTVDLITYEQFKKEFK